MHRVGVDRRTILAAGHDAVLHLRVRLELAYDEPPSDHQYGHDEQRHPAEGAVSATGLGLAVPPAENIVRIDRMKTALFAGRLS